MLAVHVADGDQQHVAVAILDGLVVDSAQVVSSQKALQEEQEANELKMLKRLKALQKGHCLLNTAVTL